MATSAEQVRERSKWEEARCYGPPWGCATVLGAPVCGGGFPVAGVRRPEVRYGLCIDQSAAKMTLGTHITCTYGHSVACGLQAAHP